MKKRNIFRIVWFSLVIIFSIWQWSTYQSINLPQDTFTDNNYVSVDENSDKITFSRNNSDYTNEIIFFQGGLTDPKAYAPICRAIAEKGYTCHLIKMDYRLPQFDYQKTHELFDLSDGHYIIGGHSQGGKMAAQFVYENPGIFTGLFLLGTSHPRDISLSKMNIPTIKIYAENDGLASIEEVLENKDKLPKNAHLALIEGGNHSQFGYLGNLLTDDNAAISLELQQTKTLGYLIEHFNDIENNF